MSLDRTNLALANTARFLGLKYRPDAYRSEELAWSAANRMKAGVVMLGDDCRFWVVCLADADRLEKAGYEFAPVPELQS